MAGPKTIELHFPAGGLNKAMPFKQQPPYTSPSMSNVRPTDTYLGRARGGSRPGLEKVFAAELGSGNPIRLLSSVTYIPTSGVLTTLEVASANGTFYKESAGNLVTIGGSLTLASNHPVRVTERVQKLYIADWSLPVAAASDGVVSGGGTTFDSATYSDWTALGANVNDYVLNIISAGSGAVVGTYKLSAIASGTLTLTTSATNATGVGFRLERAPKIYDPATNALTIWTAITGTVPVGCRLIARFRDRILLSGDPLSPNNVYGSRVADPLDFDYSGDESDATRAFALIATDAGAMGDPVTALMPHTDGCCMIGCTKSLHIIRGDPARNGSVHQLSDRIGVVDAGAWCRTPSGWTYFLSLDGLYAMPPGCGSVPTLISRTALPEELLAIDRTTTTVQMEWDVYDQGFHIFLSPTSGSTPATHYFVTTNTEVAGNPRSEFFPVAYPFAKEPTSLFARNDSTATGSKVHLGCRDGYVRRHADSVTDDDGIPFTSTVMIGPLGYADMFDGMVQQLVTTLGGDSGLVDWSMHVGKTGEEAVESAPIASGTWLAGLNATDRPRSRGAAFCLKITSTNRWTMEKINAVVNVLGRQRA